MWEQLELFLIFLRSSALALGGLASLPLLRADLVPQHATEAGIIQALAIGRLAPGPNGLYIVSLGYLVAGWVGALYAFIGSTTAPLVLVPAASYARRWLLSTWFGGVVRGVSLATAGLLMATGVTIVRSGTGQWWELALVVATVALTLHGKIHPGVMIVVGAFVGVALGR